MASIINGNVVANGKLHTANGIECVKWRENSIDTSKSLSADAFETLTGNAIGFMKEWAENQYPLMCNGWLLHCVASHLDGDTYAVSFIINNAVTGIEETHGMLTMTVEHLSTDPNAVVTFEVVPFVGA